MNIPRHTTLIGVLGFGLLGLLSVYLYQESRSDRLAKAALCAQLGNAAHEKELQKDREIEERFLKFGSAAPLPHQRLTTSNPEFSYNAELDTCLYYGSAIEQADGPKLRKWVIDTLSNKEIISSYSVFSSREGGSLSGLSQQEFGAEKKRLFAQ